MWRISFEALYVAILLLALPPLLLWTYVGELSALVGVNGRAAEVVTRAGLIWFGGALGGTLFATKWLYHAVGHGWWNADRIWWRLFTPPLSGGIAFAVVLLISTGGLPLLGNDVESKQGALAVALFVGYFSDRAAGKLNDLATKLFGVEQTDAGALQGGTGTTSTTE
jgi:hypothetical protein